MRRRRDVRIGPVAEHVGWRALLRAPGAVYSLAATQALFISAYVAFWLSNGPAHSELRVNLEFASFLVMPFVWLVLFLPGVWLVRQPLGPRSAIVVRSGLVLTAVCGCAALAVAAVIVLSELTFAVTGF